MGNATPAVKARANVVTGSNDDGGWADAMERYVLPLAP
jgi:hydroxymethylpyrimidine pyrophosphatase-like HAD family hydrolase